MEQWKEAVMGLLGTVLLQPESTVEMAALAAVALLAGAWALKYISRIAGAPERALFRNAVALALAAVLVLLASTAAWLYLLPRIEAETARHVALAGAAVVAILALAAPAAGLVLQAKYGPALTGLLGAAAAIVFMIFMAAGLFDAVRKGSEAPDHMKIRQDQLEGVVGD
jgi:hypothetical protein